MNNIFVTMVIAVAKDWSVYGYQEDPRKHA
jgi:hypothetical protein